MATKTIYQIEHINGSKVPFLIKDAATEEEALERVCKHMGSDMYRITHTLINRK